jgi:Fur family ferric uptake transcriptional regulator
MTDGRATPGDRRVKSVPAFDKQTRQREAVLRSLRDHPDFISAQALYARLRISGERIGLSTVYRVLHALADVGRVDVLRASSATPGQLFRLRAGDGHQHYLICRRCGDSVTIRSTVIEQWIAEVGGDHDFTDVDHVIELSGVCADCHSNKRTTAARPE